jgi:hypothetical protein
VVTCHLRQRVLCGSCPREPQCRHDDGLQLDGLMMGTRSGAVDPGILTFMMRQGQLDANEIDGVLNHKPGLLGISGISGDIRDILAAIGRGHERADCSRPMPDACQELGSSAAIMQSAEIRTTLVKTVARLPQPLRETFTLCAISGLSIAETAKALGLTVPVTKTRLFRARSFMRFALKTMRDNANDAVERRMVAYSSAVLKKAS